MENRTKTSGPSQWLVIPLLTLAVVAAVGTLIWMDGVPSLPDAFRYEMPDGTIPPELLRWREVASFPYAEKDGTTTLGRPLGIAVQNQTIALTRDDATVSVFVLANPVPSPSDVPTNPNVHPIEEAYRISLSAIPTCIASLPQSSDSPVSPRSEESSEAVDAASDSDSSHVFDSAHVTGISDSTDTSHFPQVSPLWGEWLVGLGNRVVRCGAAGETPFAELDASSVATGLVVEDADTDGQVDEVLVADWRGRCVWRFDGDGNLLNKIGDKRVSNVSTKAASTGFDASKTNDIAFETMSDAKSDHIAEIPEFQGFAIPSPYFDVTVTPDGLVRVTNPGYHRIEGFTADGYRETSFGIVGEQIDQFCGCCNPIHLAVLPDGRGRLVTVEKGLQRIKIYAANGKLEEVVAGPNDFAGGVSLLKDETFLQRRATVPLDSTLSNPDVSLPPDIAVSADGLIWVLDTTRMRIRVFQHHTP
ncbi:MAG: hypothetical protein PHE53_10360 [Thermoguttaceae bacterium]|nr:hypothetical protein [Thermoguttaceae bacterium]